MTVIEIPDDQEHYICLPPRSVLPLPKSKKICAGPCSEEMPIGSTSLFMSAQAFRFALGQSPCGSWG